MKSMQDYDKENITEYTVKRVGAILSSEDFTMEKVKSASQALVAILKWSNAMMKYHELLKIVKAGEGFEMAYKEYQTTTQQCYTLLQKIFENCIVLCPSICSRGSMGCSS